MRGMAAICVALFHCPDFFGKNFLFFDWGWINVDLFFLISGIVMSHVYERRIEHGLTTFTEFLSHRIARLWPMHIFAMLTILVIDIVHYYLFHKHMMDWNAPLYTFLLNLILLQNIGLYTSASLQGHTWDENAWSLTPEITANLVWFYFLARKRLSSKLLITVALIFAVLQYNLTDSLSGLILNSNLIRCTISYALGCLLYRHFIANAALKSPARPWSDLAALALSALIVCIILNLALWHSLIFNHWDWILVLFVFPAITLCALQHDTVLNRILSSRLFVFLGSISYSVYLLHVQVGMLIRGVSKHLLKSAPQTPYAGVIYVLLTIGLATLTYKFIEIPARKALRDRLEPFLRKFFFDAH